MQQKRSLQIAVVLDDMSMGGIPKASIPFMNQLLEYAEVSLIMTQPDGELVHAIPEGVKVYAISYSRTKFVWKEYWRRKQYWNAVLFRCHSLFLGRVVKRWVKNSVYIASKVSPLLQENFDCAIAYHGMNIDHLTRTLFHVNAKKKIAWIHGDHPFEGIHKKDAAQLYRMFDRIFCVSETTKEKFLSDFPALERKTDVYYNILDVNKVKLLADESIEVAKNKKETTLVTVGRVSPEKGQDLIPAAAKKLQQDGFHIKWIIVGEGNDRERIEELVKQQEVDSVVTLVGMKQNPYPYMKMCDIYVQPSYTEGYPLTIFEAAILGKPIVATDVGGTKEHLCPERDYIAVQPDVDSIAAGIKGLILDPKKREMLTKNLEQRDFSNKGEINKLLGYIM